MEGLARKINDRIDVERDITRSSVAIVVGSTDTAGAMTKIFAGSDGWRALISADGPLGSGATTNPFGAGAAACFATANVFRFVFAKQLTRGELDQRIDVSLFDYAKPARKIRPSPPRSTLATRISSDSVRSDTVRCGR